MHMCVLDIRVHSSARGLSLRQAPDSGRVAQEDAFQTRFCQHEGQGMYFNCQVCGGLLTLLFFHASFLCNDCLLYEYEPSVII